jgi:hypothetical protein
LTPEQDVKAMAVINRIQAIDAAIAADAKTTQTELQIEYSAALNKVQAATKYHQAARFWLKREAARIHFGLRIDWTDRHQINASRKRTVRRNIHAMPLQQGAKQLFLADWTNQDARCSKRDRSPQRRQHDNNSTADANANANTTATRVLPVVRVAAGLTGSIRVAVRRAVRRIRERAGRGYSAQRG